MSSKKAMKSARYRNYIISADDVEMNLSLKNSLYCKYCGVKLTFVRTHINNNVLIPCFFRIGKGKKEHFLVNDKHCPFNQDNPEVCLLDSSKTLNIQSTIEKSLYCRINIPTNMNDVKQFIEKELLVTNSNETITKKSPGSYKKSGRQLSDYINSTRGFSMLANKYWPHQKDRLFKIKFQFSSYTATWYDLYYENWDFLYKNIRSRNPKYPFCLRGTYSSHKIKDDKIEIFYTKKTISSNIVSKVFCSIKLPITGFEYLKHELDEIWEKKLKREITFFGEIEKTENNIIGYAYYRKQIFIRPLSRELRKETLK